MIKVVILLYKIVLVNLVNYKDVLIVITLQHVIYVIKLVDIILMDKPLQPVKNVYNKMIIFCKMVIVLNVLFLTV